MPERTMSLRPLTVLILAGMLGMVSTPAEAQFPQSLPPIADPTSVTAADLDGDGDPDPLSASFADDRIAWYENEGAGRFGPQRTITTRAYGARGVAAADLDGDGDPDVLSASQEQGAIFWYENDDSATFSAPKTITAQTARFWDVAATDVDGDGDPDVVAVSLGEAIWFESVIWFENQLDAPGTVRDFSLARVLDVEAGRAVSVHTDDLDGDGRSDLLLAGRGGTVAWFKNEESGAFSSSRVIARAGRSTSVHTADVNGDGSPDVLFASNGSGYVPYLPESVSEGTTVAWAENQIDDQGVFWALFNGDGFGAPQAITAKAQGPQSVSAADVNGDGAPDLLSASESEHTIAWYRNKKGSGFSKPQILTVGFSSESLSASEATDLDRDGDPDVLVASNPFLRSGHVVWYENDGTGAFAFSSVLARNMPDSRDDTVFTVADLDGDGDQDVIVGAGQKLFWCERRGEEGFATPKVITSDLHTITGIVAADRDDDGDKDLLAVSSTSRRSTMTWVENATEGFAISTGPEVKAGKVENIRSADLNGDADDDLLIETELPPSHIIGQNLEELKKRAARRGSAGVRWFENTDSTFARHPIPDAYGLVRTVDLDGDGDRDLVADEHWYANDGEGAFSARTYTRANGGGEISCCSAVDDMDGDGDPDLLVDQPNRLTWYANDGTGTFSGPVTLTRLHDPPEPQSTADVNGDGRIDVFAVDKALGTSLALLTWYVRTETGVDVDPKVDPPPAPTDVDVTLQEGTVTLRWGASEADDLRGYLIERTRQQETTAPAGSGEKWGSTTSSGTSAGATSHTDEDVRSGVTYYYRIKAMDHDFNRSRPSAEIKVHVPSDDN